MTMTVPGATECNDGTICENNAPCVPHPVKEGSYMCDCFSARGGAGNDDSVKFAGLYCEHPATSYCQRGSTTSSHAFCVNGGECKVMVGRAEEHAGCKCPGGYEGAYCQFIEGSVPSDWALDNFMHPALANAYGATTSARGAMSPGGIGWIIVGAAVGFALLAFIVGAFLYGGNCRDKLRRNEKEADTATGDAPGLSLGGRRQSTTAAAASGGATSPQNAEFIGGKSVYKRKTSTGHFVTEDTLEADGSALTKVLEEQGLEGAGLGKAGGEGGDGGEDDLTGVGTGSLEEVNLDELPSSLENKGEFS